MPDTLPDTRRPARGMKSLALALDVSRSTLYEWLKMPGHPEAEQDGTYNLAAWRAFAQQIGSKSTAGQTEDKSALQAEELRVVIKRREFDLGVKMGEYTRNDLLAQQIGELVNEAKTVLYSKFEREMPHLYSDDVAVQTRARKLNREALDEVCERLSRPLPCVEAGADEE